MKWAALALVVIIALAMFAPIAIVPFGRRGVMTTFDNPSDTVYDQGAHFRMPFAQKMNLVDVTILKGEGDGEAASKDIQVVHTKIALNYHVAPKQVVSVFRDLGNEPGQRIIVPALQEAAKAVTAGFTAEQLRLKAERDLQRIRVEAKQKVASTKAEDESMPLQRQQVAPEMIRLREVENNAKAIEKWDGKLPNHTGGPVPFIGVGR